MTDETIVKPPKTVRPLKGAEYVILQFAPGYASDGSGGIWTEVGGGNGRDAEHAVRKHAEKNGNQTGTYIAVPRKSWKPLTVTAETVTTLKLEEVKA